MEKFIYHNKGFTLVELLVYIGIAAISFILILGIIYGIIYYTSFYFDKVTLSNEMFKILHKIYYNSIEAKNIQTTTSSVSFEFNNSYEKLFASGSSLYIENASGTDRYTSSNIKLMDFLVSTSGPYVKVFINISNLKGDQNLSATSVIYKLSFNE